MRVNVVISCAAVAALSLASAAHLGAQAQGQAAGRPQDARREHRLPRDQPLRRRGRLPGRGGEGRAEDRAPDHVRQDLRGPRAAARGGRRTGCDPGGGEEDRQAAGLHPGEHPRRRGRGQGIGADPAPRARRGQARRLAAVDGAADRADLQRRRQRALRDQQPRPAERSGRRAGAAAERAELRPEPRPHEARLAGSAGVRQADDRLRPAGRDGPAHHQRLAARLLPDLRAAAQPGHRPVDHRPAAQGLAALGHQDDQVQVQLGLLLLRQPRGARRRARLALVRRPAALQQQLRRAAQPRRHPERGLRLCHLPGSDHGHQPVRRGGAELRQGARRADQEAHRRRRPPHHRRLQGGAARRDGEVGRRGRDPDR